MPGVSAACRKLFIVIIIYYSYFQFTVLFMELQETVLLQKCNAAFAFLQ